MSERETSLISEIQHARAEKVAVSRDTLTVDLTDGRTVSVPLAWYPRLVHGTAAERSHWELLGEGEEIHWPDLDEDISVAGLLLGRPSAESQRSYQRWLAQRETLTAQPDVVLQPAT
jgi:hypothetical protein